MRTFLRRLFTQESSGIAASALIISAASLLSRLLGVVRDRLLAGQFGAGVELDAYYAAFRVPDLLFNLLIVGALSAGFIPLFSEYLEQRSEKEAWTLAAQILTVITSVIAVIAALVAIAAPWIVPFFTSGFSAEGVALTVTMTRIMTISPILLGISGVMGGILQAKKQFVAFALAPVFYNIGIIIGITIFARTWGIAGVAWGVALGSFFHACIQAFPAFQLGLRGIGRRPWWSEGVRRLLWMMIPRTASLAVAQINLLIVLAFASSLSLGSVAVFTLATNIQSLPFGLIGVSVAVAAFPALSQAANQGRERSFQRLLLQQVAWLWFLLVPVTVLFYLFAPQMVYVVLGAGKFDAVNVARTTDVLRILVIALPAQSVVALLVRAYYAKQNTWTPFFVSVFAELVNLGLCLALRERYGLQGLAIAFTISTIVHVKALWLVLPQGLSKEERRVFLKTFVGVIGAALFMFIGYLGLSRFLPIQMFGAWSVLWKSLFLGGVLVTIYGGLTVLLRLPESELIWDKTRSWLKRL
jgi:putative peptidoglycan lipid II flippase